MQRMTTCERKMMLVLRVLPLAGCACLVVAALCYPGGSWWDRQSVGASFIDTFLCDLMAWRTLNGVSNRVGAGFGIVGMGLLSAALMPAWWLAGTLTNAGESSLDKGYSGRRVPRLVRGLGIVGLVPLSIALTTPGALLHAIAIPFAGLVELVALALVTTVALGQVRHRSVGVAGLWLTAIILVGLACDLKDKEPHGIKR